MDSTEDISGPNVPGQSSGGDGSLSDNQTDRMVKAIQLPEVKDLLSESTVSFPPAPAAEGPRLEPLDEQKMFKSLQAILDESEKEEGSFAVGELRASLEEADEDARHGTRDPRTLSSVKATVEKLWQSRSEYMAPAVEALANASRDRESAFSFKIRTELMTSSFMAGPIRRVWTAGLFPPDNCIDGRGR